MKCQFLGKGYLWGELVYPEWRVHAEKGLRVSNHRSRGNEPNGAILIASRCERQSHSREIIDDKRDANDRPNVVVLLGTGWTVRAFGGLKF